MDIKYKCPACGWVGTENDMEGDYLTWTDEEGFFDEVWSNWVCPGCEKWHTSLDEYEKVEDD